MVAPGRGGLHIPTISSPSSARHIAVRVAEEAHPQLVVGHARDEVR